MLVIPIWIRDVVIQHFYGDRVAVGQRVFVGVGVMGVAVGIRVNVGDGVKDGTRVFVTVGGGGVAEGPKVGVRV